VTSSAATSSCPTTADRAADLRALRYSTDLLRSAVASASPAASFSAPRSASGSASASCETHGGAGHWADD
jgi:hypothetical protein